MLGMGNAWNSGLTKFEAPDPSYWCAHGYAVCNPDMRGIAHSEGEYHYGRVSRSPRWL